MIRNWYNQIPYPTLKTKREITKYIDSSLRKAREGNRMNTSFPDRWSFSYPDDQYVKIHIVLSATATIPVISDNYVNDQAYTFSVAMYFCDTFAQVASLRQSYFPTPKFNK